MLKIDNKEFAFTATMLMRPEEVATLTFPEVPGLTFKLQADKKGAPLTSVEDNFKSAIDNNVVSISFPFLDGGKTMSGDYSVSTSVGELGLLLAANCVGDFMQVQFHGCWTRTQG